MDAALQRRIQRYGWDKAAHFYESSWQQQLKPAQDQLMELVQIKAGEKVIDIACGTGLLSFPVAKKVGAGGFVLGVDLSDHMVNIAEALAKEKGVPNIKFQQMDAEILQVEDNAYDAAIIALGLMYVPDPQQAIKEMYRVLKPGGRAAAAVWGQRNQCGWANLFEIVDKRVASEVCPMFFNMGNPTILQRNFVQAGFQQIEEVRLTTFLHYDSADEACKAAFLGGPVALAYNKFSDTIKEEANEEYIASIQPFKTDAGYKVPGEFVVVLGHK